MDWSNSGDPDYVSNVMWLINGAKEVNPPFGEVVYYEND